MATEPQGKTHSFLGQFASSRHLTQKKSATPSSPLCPRRCSGVSQELAPTAAGRSALSTTPSASLAPVQILLAQHLPKRRLPDPTERPAQNAAAAATLLALFVDCLILGRTNSPRCSKLKPLIYISMAFPKTCSYPLPLFVINPGFPSITPQLVNPSHFLPYFP